MMSSGALELMHSREEEDATTTAAAAAAGGGGGGGIGGGVLVSSGHLPPTVLSELLAELSPWLHTHRLHRMGAVLLKQGYPSPGLFIIRSGQVLVQKELEIVVGSGNSNSAIFTA